MKKGKDYKNYITKWSTIILCPLYKNLFFETKEEKGKRKEEKREEKEKREKIL